MKPGSKLGQILNQRLKNKSDLYIAYIYIFVYSIYIYIAQFKFLNMPKVQGKNQSFLVPIYIETVDTKNWIKAKNQT